MKLKYPAEAFAFGIVLFSAGMKEAFVAGILVLLTTVFAENLKNWLENWVPKWSLYGCVAVGTMSFSGSVFLLGFTTAGIPFETTGIWVMTFILGLFAAKHVLLGGIDGEYDELFWESAMIWGFWILLAVVREFCGAGTIFGNSIYRGAFQSKMFLNIMFGFLTAGLALAFTNGVLKKKSTDTWSLLMVLPLAIYMKPFAMESFGEILGQIWTIAVPVVLFLSVRVTLKFARTSRAYKGLPVEMLSMGFIYMILSIY